MATPTAAPTQGKPRAALIIFNNHLVVVAWRNLLYAILHFSFRKADLYPATWLLFFLGFAMPFFHHILHVSMCSIYTCMFSGRLFFIWNFVPNVIKANSVLPPWAFNPLVPDLLPCHVISFIRGMKRVCVQCKSRGEIQILVCLYSVAEIPETGPSKERVKERSPKRWILKSLNTSKWTDLCPFVLLRLSLPTQGSPEDCQQRAALTCLQSYSVSSFLLCTPKEISPSFLASSTRLQEAASNCKGELLLTKIFQYSQKG